MVAVFVEFYDKIFSFVICFKLAKKFLTDFVFFPNDSVKCICFAFDDVVKLEYLKF